MSGLSRREFLGQSLTALSGAVVLGGGRGAVAEPVLGAAGPVAPGQHRLPPLPYAPGALRGLSEQMVTWHHDRHFAGYINGRNAVATALAALDPTARDFDSKAYKGLKKQEAVHACGAALHTVYFDILGGDGTPGRQDVVAALRRDFGSLARWRADLSAAAHAAGIGWGLTCWDPACRRLIHPAHLVEGHNVPVPNEADLAPGVVVEEVGARCLAARNQDAVRRELAEGVGLARPPRPQFDEVVVLLDKGD